MSVDYPEVGDVFRWSDIYSRTTYDYFITNVDEYSQTVWFIRSDGYCDEYSFSTIASFTYIGKSKTNINSLFEVQNDNS